jgi:transcriptional regulator with XRE-family HTH domain
VDKSIYSEKYKVAIALLREERKRAGISQIELAKRLNETQSFVSKVERLDRRLDIIELYEFCQAIGIRFSEFAQKLESKLK